MNTLFAAVVASTLAFGAISASATELTDEERIELRQRAEALQADRLQNPDRRADGVKLNQERGDVRLNQQRSEVKKTTAKAKKKSRRRSIKDLPGALVR